MPINKLEKIDPVKVLTYTNSIDNININTSPNTSNDQIHILNWENPLIHNIFDQDSLVIKLRSWTLIKPESVISDIAFEPSWNLDESKNIGKNTCKSISTDNTYSSVKDLFKLSMELMSDIVKDISAKEFNTSVKVCWSKRTNVFRLTTKNQKLQKVFWNKTQKQLSSLKSKKTDEKKVTMIYETIKSKLFIKILINNQA